MTKLSVNLNKIALLRNSRETKIPSVIEAAETVIAGGADGITVHPRPDQRHITPDDVYELSSLLNKPEYNHIEFNIEGNPLFPEQANGYPGFINLVEKVRPTQCTLVPDSNDQLTSDHGWNFDEITFDFQQLVDRLKSQGIRTSAFLDTDYHQINLAKKMGLECIELYTGPYANSFGGDMQIENLSKLVSASEKCINLGLVVNAGHDLNQQNLPMFVQQVPEVREVSIGHALICDSIYQGLEQTVKNYKSILIEHSKRP